MLIELAIHTMLLCLILLCIEEFLEYSAVLKNSSMHFQHRVGDSMQYSIVQMHCAIVIQSVGNT